MNGVFAPQTLQMPPAQWAVRKNIARRGFTQDLTMQDLALDPERVLMQGTLQDGLAAAIVDAEESADMTAIDERQDLAAADAQHEFRDWWDVGASYVHPDVGRDVSVGPGAWTVADPTIVPNHPLQDVNRKDASAALFPVHRQQMQCACGCQTIGCEAAGCATHACGCSRAAQAAVRCACNASAPQRQQQRQQPHLTAPEDDEATQFMVSSHAPGRGPVTTAGSARAAQYGASRMARRGTGGPNQAAARAMRPMIRAGLPVSTDADVYGLAPQQLRDTQDVYAAGPVCAGGGGDGGYGGDAATYGVPRVQPLPSYDAPYAPVATLGAPNPQGLYHMPGTVDTAAVLAARDGRVQGYPTPWSRERGGASAALGFRFPERNQFQPAVPKFYPSRDPLDKLIYERAAETAPDMAADLEDMAFGRDMTMIEPLSARWAHMQEVAKDMTHVRDFTMVPRTGPSVVDPTRLAQPPAWYVRPGTAGRGR